jgi:cytosine deaminase
MLDHIIRRASLIGADQLHDIGIADGRFVEISPRLDMNAPTETDAAGCLVVPPFVDSHFHLDAALSLGQPSLNQSGTLLEGIQIWAALKPSLNAAAIKERAMALLHWSIAQGTLIIRSHVDVTDPSLLAVEVLLEVKKEMSRWIDLQLVAFPQDGLLRCPDGRALLTRALDLGVEVIGGIPHYERTMAQGSESITWLCELAEKRGLLVDMHCDESDDPLSRHIEHLTAETSRLGLGGRVTASHLTSMHSMDNYYVSKLLPLMAESGIQAVCNPLINIHIQGRHDTYPKRRGLTRVPELLAAGVNVAFGHDCVMDPWYPMGTHDMLEVAHMGAHCLQMMGAAQADDLLAMVTSRGAAVLNRQDYGIRKGNPADCVILQASDAMQAIRLRAARLQVFRRGRIIAGSVPRQSEVVLDGPPVTIDFRR